MYFLCQPLLQKNGVKVVGIGLEQLGSEEFVESGYLAGDVYVDEKKQSYQDLGFKRLNSTIILLLSSFHQIYSHLSVTDLTG